MSRCKWIWLCVVVALFVGGLPTQAQTKKKATKPQTTTTKKAPAPAQNKRKGNTKSAETQSINTLKKEQQDLNKRISTNEKQLKQTQQQVRTQLQNLEQINGEITKQDAVVKQVRGEVAKVGQQVTVLDGQRGQLQAELDEIKRRYQRSLLYMTRHRTALSKLLFVFSAKDFSQMYRRMKYMNLYARYQRAQGETIQRKEAELLGVKTRLQETQQTKQTLLQQEQQAHSQLQKQQSERQTIVTDLQNQQKTLQAILDADRKKYAQLNSRIDQLVAAQIAAAERARKAAEAAEAARKKREAEAQAAAVRAKQQADAKRAAANATKAKQANTKNAQPTTAPIVSAPAPTKTTTTATPAVIPVVANNADATLSNNFAANKGRLPAPITGSYRITSHFGANTVEGLSGVTLDNKGTNYTTNSPSQARAIFDGEVSAVFSIGGQMNVMVRHGSYISVYCNLSGVSVRQGQKVKTNQTLGNVSSDGNGGYTLHFQLRKETSKLNPAAWVR